MDRKIMLALIFLTFFLVSCGGGEVQATQRTVDKVLDTESPTGAAIQQVTTVKKTETTETGTTAAEALKDLQDTEIQPTVSGGGDSIYSGTSTSATGKDALAEKTRQAYSQGLAVGDVEADDQFGPKYYNNLPDGYGNDDSAGD